MNKFHMSIAQAVGAQGVLCWFLLGLAETPLLLYAYLQDTSKFLFAQCLEGQGISPEG